MYKYTPEDLIQYLYHETSLQKTEDIKSALETDWNLSEMFSAIKLAHMQLESIHLSPRNETVDNILRYAEKPIEELHH